MRGISVQQYHFINQSRGNVSYNLIKKENNMLGEKVGSFTATTVNKALPAVNNLPAMETTGTGQGMLVGQPAQFIATYTAIMQPDGSFYGESPQAGIIMSASGAGTFRATGAGSPTAEGGFKFRGACYFSSQAPAFAGLNGKTCVYTWDVDAEGNATWELWEWL